MSETTKVDLTPERALELLRRARDEKGSDYVYRAGEIDADGFRYGECMYFEDDGTPSCIVGHVFAWADDIEPDDVTEGTTADDVACIFDLPESVGYILRAAQEAQDGGATWGEAVEAAEAEARRQGVAA